MAMIREVEDLEVHREEHGWVETTLADSTLFGHAAMVARRWSLEPGARSPSFVHGEQEQMLYVIAGSGRARVNSEHYALMQENLLWMEPGDRYHLEAGEQGLEILVGFAPGE